MGKNSESNGASTTWRQKLGISDSPSPNHFKGKATDIVILFMGPTGVGKSTFIREYTNDGAVQVGHELQSCTRDVAHYFASPPSGTDIGKRRLVLVDTPGFDDTFSDDSDILKRVTVWLAQAYNSKAQIAGIVYLNDITQKRMLGSTRTNFNMFSKLCGQDSYHSVLLATSQWDQLADPRVGEQRQQELTNTFWNEVTEGGASVQAIRAKPRDQEVIIATLIQTYLDRKRKRQEYDVLQIQKEIVDLERSLPATKAGQELKYTLQELLKLQKASMSEGLDERGRQELEKKQQLLKEQIKHLKLSLGDFFKKFFGLL